MSWTSWAHNGGGAPQEDRTEKRCGGRRRFHLVKNGVLLGFSAGREEAERMAAFLNNGRSGVMVEVVDTRKKRKV